MQMTQIHSLKENIYEIKNILSLELNNVSEWVRSNKLTLNISKTHYMVTHSLMTPVPHINLTMNNNTVIRVEEFNFLGTAPDSSLRWKTHVEVKTKISRMTGVFYHIRDFLP